MTLGEKLQRLRRARAWTQEQLAERIGVSRQSLSKWESDGALPDTANVIALADLFGVTTDYLLRDEPAAPTAPPSTTDAPQEDDAPQEVQMPPQPDAPVWMRRVFSWVMLAVGALGLVVLRLCASLYPAYLSINDREYTGFAGFVLSNDLMWMVVMLLLMLVAGIVMVFGPWLLWQVRRLNKWLKDDD